MKKIILLLATITIFVFFNYNIYVKENIIENGEKIFLELRPVDPRSFMQGDYMALRFKIEEDARFNANESVPLKGKIEVTINEQKIGHFDKLYIGGDLNANQRLFDYRLTNLGINIIPDSFMFQEGHASFYEKAKYGVFKFIGHEYLLTGLADEHLNEIKPLAETLVK
ncbi:MAG: GDYXXLXY domain-containing protein [Alphaproteobacteria bacterium]|nr:GDYXXLXY domain-containing protein [Alphaproteobacteria bacterium]